MNKTSSAKQFPDILKNQIKTYWDKMHHKNINQIVSLLKLDELEILDWILAGDLKFANVCFGRISDVL